MHIYHFGYSVTQWLFLFYFYCFCGWCFESAYVSLKDRKWTNRGFMRGPFLPLYGSGAIMMLVVSAPFRESIVLTYFAGVVGATVLEYVTGVVMEALFKVRYWDYSQKRFNFQGHICLGSSLAWGMLTILMTEFVHDPVEKLVLGIPEVAMSSVTLLLTVLIAGDFSLAFRNAMDLRDILVKMENAKLEVEHLQKRLDVYLAFAAENNAARFQTVTEAASNIKASAVETASNVKASAVETASNVRDEIIEFKRKFAESLQKRVVGSDRERAYRRSVFHGNPDMYSVKYKEAFEELKRRTEEDRKEDQGE